jgi:serine/threonine-protein kinase
MYHYTPSDNRHPGAAPQWQPPYPPPPAGYAHVVREWRKPSVNPYGVSWPQPPAPPLKRRSKRWVGITAGVLALAAVASAIVWWPHSTGEGANAAPAVAAVPPVSPVPMSAMDELLLTRAQAGKLFGTEPMGGREDRSDRVYSQMAPHTEVVDDECNHGVPGLTQDHEGSGWQAVRHQFLTTLNTEASENERTLTQAVVNFPDAATAQGFVETSKATWQRCANRSVNLKVVANGADPNLYWNTGAVSETAAGIRMTWTQEGHNGWACQDSMTPHNNVVIELELCGRSPSMPVDEAIAQITDKIENAK